MSSGPETMDLEHAARKRDYYDGAFELAKPLAQERFDHLQWAMTDDGGPHYGIALYWAETMVRHLEQVVTEKVELARLARFLPQQMSFNGTSAEVPCALGVRVVVTDSGTGVEVIGRVEQFYLNVDATDTIGVRVDSEPSLVFPAVTLRVLADQS